MEGGRPPTYCLVPAAAERGCLLSTHVKHGRHALGGTGCYICVLTTSMPLQYRSASFLPGAHLGLGVRQGLQPRGQGGRWVRPPTHTSPRPDLQPRD